MYINVRSCHELPILLCFGGNRRCPEKYNEFRQAAPNETTRLRMELARAKAVAWLPMRTGGIAIFQDTTMYIVDLWYDIYIIIYIHRYYIII